MSSDLRPGHSADSVDRVGEGPCRTVGELLFDGANATPDDVFLRFEDGREWTWAASKREALQACTCTVATRAW